MGGIQTSWSAGFLFCRVLDSPWYAREGAAQTHLDQAQGRPSLERKVNCFNFFSHFYVFILFITPKTGRGQEESAHLPSGKVEHITVVFLQVHTTERWRLIPALM